MEKSYSKNAKQETYKQALHYQIISREVCEDQGLNSEAGTGNWNGRQQK